MTAQGQQGQPGLRVAVGIGGDTSDERLTFARQMGCSGVVVATPPLPGAQPLGGRRAGPPAGAGGALRAARWRPSRTPPRPGSTPSAWTSRSATGRSRTTRRRCATSGGPASPCSATTGAPTPSTAPATRPAGAGPRSPPSTARWPSDRPLSYEPGVQRRRDVGQLRATSSRPCSRWPRRPACALALHPDDPPGGTHRRRGRASVTPSRASSAAAEIVRQPGLGPALLHRLLERDGRPGRTSCAASATSARAGKIVYVHFRDVQGTGDRFARVLHRGGQRGRRRPSCATLKEVGFTGFLIDDHVPAHGGRRRPGLGRPRAGLLRPATSRACCAPWRAPRAPAA